MVQQIRSMVPVLAALAILAAPGALSAQKGKPKPAGSYPGTAQFRCDVGFLCEDGLVGTGTYVGIGSNETGSGPHLNLSNGELWFGKVSMRVDFGFQRPTLCDAPGQSECRWAWPTDPQARAAADVYLAEIQTNVVLGPNGVEASGGLLSIAAGGTGDARFKMTVVDGAGVSYWLNFDAADGSTTVKVSRSQDGCTWTFMDDHTGDGLSSDDARAFLRSGTRRGRVDEGLFHLPFALTFTASGGCAP